MSGSRARLLSLSLVSLLSLLVACGGKVVVDATNQGGGGSGSSTTSSVSVGVGGACGDLGAVLEAKIDAAQACNPQGSVAQCSGAVVVFDGCSCTLAANTMTPEIAADAVNAFNVWVSAGCGPVPCLTCPPPPAPEAPWACDSTTKRCSPHL